MINPLSNQNYYNPYNTVQATQPASNAPMARQQSDGVPAPAAGTPEVKKNQEIEPK